MLTFPKKSAAICRDERCNIVEIHARHFISAVPEPKPHHRARKIKCSVCAWRGVMSFERMGCPKCGQAIEPVREVQPWEVHDELAIVRAIANATSKSHPVSFSMIYRDVCDDYGQINERTVHRHLAKLVDRGCLLKFDIDMPFSAYIRPGTRMTLAEIREYEYDTIATPDQEKRRKTKRSAEGVSP